MRYHWIRDQVDLEQIEIKWEPGATNLADFFTKNHPTKHHAAMRHIFVHDQPQQPIAHMCVLANVLPPSAPVYSDTNNSFSCLAV